MADIIVYDKTFTAVGMFDVQLSLIWERRFYEAGYFELHIPQTEYYNKLIDAAQFLLRADSLEGGIVTYTNKRTDEDGNGEYTLIGRFLSFLFEYRPMYISTPYIEYKNRNAEELMREIVTNTVMSENRSGYIPQVTLGELCGSGKVIKNLRLGGDTKPTLHEALSEISRLSGVGFRLRASPNDGLLYFECFDGLDKTAEQTENIRVIFSPDYDTIKGSAEYTADDSVTVNAVTMRFYNSDLGAISVRYMPEEVSGLELREVTVTTNEYVPNASGGVNAEATKRMLQLMARDYIRAKKETMSVSVAYSGTYVYKTDYDIGDIVTVQYKPYGITMNRRIHKITENYTADGKQVIPAFGAIMPSGKDDEDI